MYAIISLVERYKNIIENIKISFKTWYEVVLAMTKYTLWLRNNCFGDGFKTSLELTLLSDTYITRIQ